MESAELNNSMITRFLFIYSNVCLNAFLKLPIWHDKISALKQPITRLETEKTPLMFKKVGKHGYNVDKARYNSFFFFFN